MEKVKNVMAEVKPLVKLAASCITTATVIFVGGEVVWDKVFQPWINEK